MCVFHSSQFTFMTRNQAAQPPNIIVDTKSGVGWLVKYIITQFWSAPAERSGGVPGGAAPLGC
jgi:hypothetical protein